MVKEEHSRERISPEFLSGIGKIASDGRKALERHPDSPVYEKWSRDQFRHHEKSPANRRERKSYTDLVPVDGPGDATNQWGVLNHILKSPVREVPGTTVNDYLWDFAENAVASHPGRQLSYTGPEYISSQIAELDSFMKDGLGYDPSQNDIHQDEIHERINVANGLEEYFDRLMTVI